MKTASILSTKDQIEKVIKLLIPISEKLEIDEACHLKNGSHVDVKVGQVLPPFWPLFVYTISIDRETNTWRRMKGL